MHRLEKDVGQLNRFPIWLPLFILAVAVDIATVYVNSFVEWEWKNIVSGILVSQVIPLLLALFWSGIGRFMREESNFLGHYSLILLASLIYTASEWIIGVIGYNLSAEILINSIAPLFGLLLGAILLSANFALATNMLARQRWITSAGFIALLIVISITSQMKQLGEFSPYPEYFSAIELPALQISSAETVDNYILSLDDVFVEAERQAEKK